MKYKIATLALLLFASASLIKAQNINPAGTEETSNSGSTIVNAQKLTKAKKIDQKTAKNNIFKCYLVNDEYQVWFDIDLYNNSISVPGQAVFGELPGYFGAKRDTRKWLISEAKVKGNTAELLIINDYGSEDLKAELKYNNDGTYTFRQLSGSTMKIVVNRKWVKIPKELTFKKQ